MKQARIVVVVFLILTAARAQEVITIDPSAPARPFPHFWEKMFGSGRAVLTLRDDYRRDLHAVKAITGFGYVRFHAIFLEDVGLYNQDKQGKPFYNFSYVDQIYDGLLANGVRPFVELSFMPNQIASGPPSDSFWYHFNPSPPREPPKWAGMIDTFVRHLLARYGAREVEQWYFEVWNEPNIDFWTGKPAEETYFALYDATARTIKRADPKLRVGGPATAQAAWVDRFIEHCTKSAVPFDFVSTHIYGNDSPRDVFANDIPVPMKDMVGRAIAKVHDQVERSAAPRTPLIVSEFNAAYLTRVDVEDSAFMGPWLANTIRECDGLTSMMSYWTFSDVFEEQGVVKRPFYGGYGLVAERNIPKPAFRAFELLHQLGIERLASNADDILLTKKPGGSLIAAIWNYSEAGQPGKEKTVRLQFKDGRTGTYRIQFIDPQHGSALAAWTRMGSPDFPTREQIAQLIAASQIAPPTEHNLNDPIHLVPHELALVQLNP